MAIECSFHSTPIKMAPWPPLAEDEGAIASPFMSGETATLSPIYLRSPDALSREMLPRRLFCPGAML